METVGNRQGWNIYRREKRGSVTSGNTLFHGCRQTSDKALTRATNEALSVLNFSQLAIDEELCKTVDKGPSHGGEFELIPI